MDPEDAGDSFLRNVKVSPKYMALQPRNICNTKFRLSQWLIIDVI
jgi:hypothetical protein